MSYTSSATSFRQRMLSAAAQGNQGDVTQVPMRKRTRDESSSVADGDDDCDPQSPPLLTSPGVIGPVSRNAVVAVRNFAKRQKLRGDQLAQLDAFLNDIQTVREGKLFTLLLSMQNDVGNIIVATPPFTVSLQLKTNIQSYALSVLLSPKVAQYTGERPVQHVYNILKKHGSDLPPGIENVPADMKTLTSEIQDALTKARSNAKRKLFASVRFTRVDQQNVKTVHSLEPGQHQNIFVLAQSFVDRTKCRITNALCGRVALMRDVYIVNSGVKYWIEVDNALMLVRKLAGCNEYARDAMFEDLIETDKKLHGAVDIVYQPTDESQQEVDDIIDAAADSTERDSSLLPDEDVDASEAPDDDLVGNLTNLNP